MEREGLIQHCSAFETGKYIICALSVIGVLERLHSV